MNNVLFNAETLEVVGVNRPALPYEIEVKTKEGFNPVKMVVDKDKLVPKRDALGNKLYWDGDKEVTYNLKPIAFEETVEKRKHVGEDGKVREREYKIEKPVKFEPLKAVLVPSNAKKQVSLLEHPKEFTYEEIIEAKKKYIQADSLNTVLFYNEEVDENILSTNLSNFSADLGLGFITLHPKGQVRTNKIQLPTAVKNLEVYAEIQDGIKVEVGVTASDFVQAINGLVSFPEPVKEVYVRFTNTVDKRRQVSAFGLLG